VNLPPMTRSQLLATLELLAEQHPDPVIARACGELLAEQGGEEAGEYGCPHGFVASSCSQCRRAGRAGWAQGVIVRSGYGCPHGCVAWSCSPCRASRVA
jgi:hypothetical protein